ncbi:hypothetical protein CEUSTIGMA_g1715.t1 [Chlamydomonas eustigma]|uniref:Uncharacterized protein n=1 Tax=Chlamydomonas eustigma TaxID=1157962 RepID=A0A250WU37_9CHLO|nr:hypothetical protein CEUSTIGMA_g1715.t1 [Chlamydomonas eustigma]|eukprot:GAX74266.1 hypothetical protein CEUSTIGMA_g1715.t1 [Chlamydomonas eustigma]
MMPAFPILVSGIFVLSYASAFSFLFITAGHSAGDATLLSVMRGVEVPSNISALNALLLPLENALKPANLSDYNIPESMPFPSPGLQSDPSPTTIQPPATPPHAPHLENVSSSSVIAELSPLKSQISDPSSFPAAELPTHPTDTSSTDGTQSMPPLIVSPAPIQVHSPLLFTPPLFPMPRTAAPSLSSPFLPSPKESPAPLPVTAATLDAPLSVSSQSHQSTTPSMPAPSAHPPSNPTLSIPPPTFNAMAPTPIITSPVLASPEDSLSTPTPPNMNPLPYFLQPLPPPVQHQPVDLPLSTILPPHPHSFLLPASSSPLESATHQPLEPIIDSNSEFPSPPLPSAPSSPFQQLYLLTLQPPDVTGAADPPLPLSAGDNDGIQHTLPTHFNISDQQPFFDNTNAPVPHVVLLSPEQSPTSNITSQSVSNVMNPPPRPISSSNMQPPLPTASQSAVPFESGNSLSNQPSPHMNRQPWLYQCCLPQ